MLSSSSSQKSDKAATSHSKIIEDPSPHKRFLPQADIYSFSATKLEHFWQRIDLRRPLDPWVSLSSSPGLNSSKLRFSLCKISPSLLYSGYVFKIHVNTLLFWATVDVKAGCACQWESRATFLYPEKKNPSLQSGLNR